MTNAEVLQEIIECVAKLDMSLCYSVLCYVRGVHNGVQLTKYQHGLDNDQPKPTTGGTVLKFVKPEGKK